MTWRAFPRVAAVLLPLLLPATAPAPAAPIAYLGAMTPSVHGRPTLPCRIGTVATTCIIDTGSAPALVLPQGMAGALPTNDGAMRYAVAGVTGTEVVTASMVPLRIAGQTVDVMGAAVPGYDGKPLVGDGALRLLKAIVVVDAAQGTDWFVVER